MLSGFLMAGWLAKRICTHTGDPTGAPTLFAGQFAHEPAQDPSASEPELLAQYPVIGTAQVGSRDSTQVGLSCTDGSIPNSYPAPAKGFIPSLSRPAFPATFVPAGLPPECIAPKLAGAMEN